MQSVLFSPSPCILINAFLRTQQNYNSYNSTCIMDIALKLLTAVSQGLHFYDESLSSYACSSSVL